MEEEGKNIRTGHNGIMEPMVKRRMVKRPPVRFEERYGISGFPETGRDHGIIP
jgi:hypothetical protein